MKRVVLILASTIACGCALAQTSPQGRPAPTAVLDQIKDVPLTHIGSQRVRALPPESPLRSLAKGGSAATTTTVVRESDNLVGISNNELVIVSPELEAIAAKVATLGLTGAQTRSYPRLQLRIVSTARFEQLETVRSQVAAAFPAAKFDLPVTYFPLKPR